jgi:hypothetical protein
MYPPSIYTVDRAKSCAGTMLDLKEAEALIDELN